MSINNILRKCKNASVHNTPLLQINLRAKAHPCIHTL